MIFSPYEYMSNFEKFKDELPIKSNCYSDKDYKEFLKFWNKFEVKIMRHYHNLYLKCDVLKMI